MSNLEKIKNIISHINYDNIKVPTIIHDKKCTRYTVSP